MQDFGITTFNSKGQLKQIENAIKAVSNGELSIGLTAKDAVILISEKTSKNPLIDFNSIHKVEKLSNNQQCTYAGLSADFKVLVQKARKENTKYKMQYNEDVPLSYSSRKIANIMQESTQSGGVRPFGVGIILAGTDGDNNVGLTQIDPSGAYYDVYATALGKNENNAKLFLEKRWKRDMSEEDVLILGLKCLKESFDGDIKEFNVEISILKNDSIKQLSSEEIKDYLNVINN